MYDKPRKFYEKMANAFLNLNEYSYKKFEGDYTGAKFHEISKKQAQLQRNIEVILDKEGYNVSRLYSERTLLYLASIGEMVQYKKNKPLNRDRKFMVSLYQELENQLSKSTFHKD